jgi:hypothetical protein
MAKYEFKVEETHYGTIIVEADNEDQAYDNAVSAYFFDDGVQWTGGDWNIKNGHKIEE